jgi:diguanylate cyclase (GGDEF)-like protein/PAS domain S-box-containing protein
VNQDDGRDSGNAGLTHNPVTGKMAKKNLNRAAAEGQAALKAPSRPPSGSAVSLSALREQAEGLRRAQGLAGLAHVVTRPDGSFESWSETLPTLLGLEVSEVATSTRRWLDLVHPAEREKFRAAALEARAKRERRDVEYRILRSDGQWVHVRQVMEPIKGAPDAQGRYRWFNTLQDITAQKLAEEHIRRLNRVHAVLSGINSLIIRARSRDVLFTEVCKLAVADGGFRMAWIGLLDADATRITPVAWAGDMDGYLSAVPLSAVEGAPDFGASGRAVAGRTAIISQDLPRDRREPLRREALARGIGSLAKIPLIWGGKGIGVLSLYAAEPGHFDAAEMRLLQDLAADIAFALEYFEKNEKAEYLAYYDPLTTLANRSLFQERLAQLVTTSAAEQFAVVLIDLERFKTLNDTFGRAAGDAVLKKVAERVTALVPHIRVSRIGADQFALIAQGFQTEAELAERIERRLKELFGTAYALADTEVRISGRLGVALYPQHGRDPEALFRNAEAALKKAKQASERYLFYHPNMSDRVAENASLETKLRRAIEQEQFVLHYQPKIDLESRKVTGVEALLRWQDPQAGLVPPGRFIPLLEETGLILDVGAWAMRRAAADHRAWTEQGLAAPRIAVNVSAIQLRQRTFVQAVRDAIAAGLSPCAIDLEITESLLMHDIQANIEKLKVVRELGINLAIDDFGTGYSSLAYLAKLPVQVLKIDRSFITSIHSDADATTLVSTMISLAHSMRLKVVAEGVETEDQARILRLLRCDEMQGYLFSKPLPAEQLLPLLQSR